MTKIVSCRIDEHRFNEFVDMVHNLHLTNSEVLHQIITIFINVNRRLQYDKVVSFEERYNLVKNEVNEFLSCLNGVSL